MKEKWTEYILSSAQVSLKYSRSCVPLFCWSITWLSYPSKSAHRKLRCVSKAHIKQPWVLANLHCTYACFSLEHWTIPVPHEDPIFIGLHLWWKLSSLPLFPPLLDDAQIRRSCRKEQAIDNAWRLLLTQSMFFVKNSTIAKPKEQGLLKGDVRKRISYHVSANAS